MWRRHVLYMLHLLCTVHVMLLMYRTCYISYVQYMLHFLCAVHGPRTDTDLDEASKKRIIRRDTKLNLERDVRL
jgi:hypothetical protein